MKKQKPFPRSAGILMPVFSLPSRFGIGAFGREAYRFVDFLESAGQTFWQVLPLGPTSYGDSPYQSFSAFAGNPYFIDPETLSGEGLLLPEEMGKRENSSGSVDYEKLYRSRFDILKKAYGRWKAGTDFDEFCEENCRWLEPYCLFMALKTRFGGAEWLKWPRELRLREPEAMRQAEKKLRSEIDFWKFCQYQFYVQWNALKTYANKKGISLIGDIPIYAALDSADAWAEPEVFYLDSEGFPVEVAGCPPDAFSDDGQLWGNPLYRWDFQQKTDFDWWKRRLTHISRLYDVVRIDHFRGLESFYAIPFGDTTARNGVWRKGPGISFFEQAAPSLGNTRLILEDLGYLTEDVHRLRRRVGAPGMKVLQFAFGSGPENEYLPHNYDTNCVVYTGTHDNDTTAGWFRSASRRERAFARRYLGISQSRSGCRTMVRLAMFSAAALAVIPLQDYLELGSEARINTPSTLGKNWRWRLCPGAADDTLAEKIRALTELSGRLPKRAEKKNFSSPVL